jgi:hypothetical protein
MKMIYVGTLCATPDRDSGWISSFEKLGCNVIQFCSEIAYPETGLLMKLFWKVCNRLNIGPRNKRMQMSLLALVEQEEPVWIHFRLPIGFDRKMIQALRSKNIVVTQYFNDDAFSKRSPFGLQWKFHAALTAYDAHFVYRAHNVESYRKAGVSYVEHCPPAYDPKRHYILNSRPDTTAASTAIHQAQMESAPSVCTTHLFDARVGRFRSSPFAG